ncbi:Acetyltransferase (GNAT) domain-containing protein [Parapedobacter composti]|uniref:Acetyltransferase (GNAT) domain-containing protein n=1 Tax=Parapedobacter composti TaxID=623281 RepID=A0A1I1HSA1_9SPHI|nr:GNAT family N-acetyltransferase [Parapedobacter composti]SFC26756.1 Acetyltransferase (GNAT) domain-containing protein [Parapedobacter composti]
MEYQFRPAKEGDVTDIWRVLQQAIIRRKNEGSEQWQDGYPNPEVIQHDIEKQAGFVMTSGDTIVGYCAILINDEPAYAGIEGKWLTDGDFVVFHRVAIADSHIGKGLSKLMFAFIENYALEHNIYSVRADTNFDNLAMLKIFERAGYTYCGEVFFRNRPRRAYEKVLANK